MRQPSPQKRVGTAPRLGVRALAIVCAALLGCALSAAGARAAQRITPGTPVTPGSGYLALGDSVSFGYMEPTVVPAPDYAHASAFRGYPEMLASQLHLKLANLSCPGETSASLLDPNAQSNGCENALGGGAVYRPRFPLHVRYSGSQIAAAERYLRGHPGTRLVTLMIGANDTFVCQQQSPDGCRSPSELAAVLSRIGRNVHAILAGIRNRAGYRGQIVIVDYYSLDYGSALDNAASRALNRAEAAGARGFRVRTANGFATFRMAAARAGQDPCRAGLLTQLGSATKCGIHPSYAGQALLAATVAGAIRIG